MTRSRKQSLSGKYEVLLRRLNESCQDAVDRLLKGDGFSYEKTLCKTDPRFARALEAAALLESSRWRALLLHQADPEDAVTPLLEKYPPERWREINRDTMKGELKDR